MSVLVHGYDSWYVVLREVYRLNIFKNRALRGICEHRWREVTGSVRKFHTGQLDDV